MTERRLTDEQMDAGMGRLLQAGVLLASGVVLAGGLLLLWAGGTTPVSYRTFTSEPARLREWSELLRAIEHGEPTALVQLGILLLIATPVARVVFALVAFLMQRDRMYVGVSLLVLLVLGVGLVWMR